MKHATNCFLLRADGKVLLSMKKRGFGVGNWNGSGGKVQEGESVEEAAVREVSEEIGVTLATKDLEKVYELNYIKTDDPQWGMFVHGFIVRTWSGEPTESEEMKPAWFDLDKIPYDKTWADTRHWLLKVLAGEKVKGDFIYKPDGKSLERFDVASVVNF